MSLWRGPQVTALDHINRLLVEMDLRYQQRFDAQNRALDAALLAAEKAVQSALVAAEKAVTKAEVATEKRLEGLNELRSIVNDINSLQMPRLEAEQRLLQVTEKYDDLRTEIAGLRESRSEGRGSAVHATAARQQSNWTTELLVSGAFSALAAILGGAAVLIALLRH